MIGSIVGGRYRIERLVGAGGMGSVYEAEDETSGARVAVKVINRNIPSDAADFVARFEREARAAGSIDTEHIARCLGAGADPETGRPFMVMEYLEGEDVQHVLKRLGPLAPELALRITAQACVGLAKAHAANIIHRDIKPANIFLARTDRGDRIAKLLDFGVAKIRRDPGDLDAGETAGLTRTGSMLGSPLYMSPEQARSVKHVDQRSDLWSLGVVLYQTLAGRTPYQHISGLGDLILALCSQQPPPVQQFAPWVPLEIAAILDRVLRIDPSERFQTADEMLAALLAWLPDGTALDEAMLKPLDEETHDHIAPAYLRGFATPGTGGTLMYDGSPAPNARASGPGVRDDVTGDGATVLVESSSQPGNGRQATQTAVAMTGAGLGVDPRRSEPQRGRSAMPMVAVAVGCLAAGGIGVYAFLHQGVAAVSPPVTMSPPGQPAVSAPVPAPTPSSSPPIAAPQPPEPAVAPTATGSAAAPASAAPAPPSIKPVPVLTGTLPRSRPTSAPTATARPRDLPLDSSGFGDRK